MKFICWGHSYFDQKSSILISLRFLLILYRICTGGEGSKVGNVKNASDLIQCFTITKCTYSWNRESRRVKSNESSNMESTKCTEFYNQYNIGSWNCFQTSARFKHQNVDQTLKTINCHLSKSPNCFSLANNRCWHT